MTLSKTQRSIALWAALGGALVAASAWALWPQPLTLELTHPHRDTLRVQRTDQGTTRVRDLYTVSAPTSGVLGRLQLEAGDAVTAGQTLAHLRAAVPVPLDPRRQAEATAATAAARARLDEAQLRTRLALSELERLQKLAAQHMVSDSALATARSAWAEAGARQTAAQADWAAAQASTTAGWTQPGQQALAIKSPVAGVVLRTLVTSETSVAAGTPLLELGDLSALEVVAEFISEDAVQMAPGAPATIENWGGPPVAAQVLRVEPLGEKKVSALGVEEQRVKVVLSLNQAPAALGHGYRVDARVTVRETPNVLLLPVQALSRTAQGWRAWVVSEGRAQPRRVEVGESDGQHRVVTEGLSEGDAVVLRPPPGLEVGQRVKAEAAAAK